MIEQALGDGGKVLLSSGGGDVGGVGQEAAEDAHDVAIENGVGLIEGDAGDGGGGVFADAGKVEKGVVGLWKNACLGDGLGGFLKIARAVIVAESGPVREQIGFGGGGERFDGREAIEKAFEVRDDGGDAGLLEHNFREQDGVGIAGATPREIALVAVEPGEEFVLEEG